MGTGSEKSARLDLRLEPEAKELIVAAASAAGVSVSAFATRALEREATRVLDEQRTTRLSRRDWETFVRLLDEEEANEALRVAAADFVATHGS